MLILPPDKSMEWLDLATVLKQSHPDSQQPDPASKMIPS